MLINKSSAKSDYNKFAALERFIKFWLCPLELYAGNFYANAMHAKTRRQREVFEIIARYMDTHGYRPSYQLIANQLKLRSRAGIARIVYDLEAQGLLERRREDGHFSIEMKAGESSVSVAWLDVPDVTGEDHSWQGRPLSLPQFLIGDLEAENVRAFLVPDHKMSPEIERGDIALIELRDFCRDGATVVAILEDKTPVIRTYYRVNAEIELRTPNDRSEPIIVPADKVKIAGIYRGLVRPAG